MKKVSQQEWIYKANQIHNNKYDYCNVIYVKSCKKVEIVCKKHGLFYQVPNNHLRGQGCPQCKLELCSKKLSAGPEKFIKKSNIIHNNLYLYNNIVYKNNNTKVCITCKLHGDFYQRPKDHLNGNGCPSCNISSQRKLFDKLKLYYTNENIILETSKEVKWLYPQRFDIYFPDHNIAIEYNGEQHYKPIKLFGGEIGLKNTMDRDSLKRYKCKQNNCKLFELKYDYKIKDYKNLINAIDAIIINKN